MKKKKKITKRDLLEIEKISHERFGNESWTEAQFESSYSLDSSIFLVSFEKEKLVSFLIGQDTVDSINILLLATEKEFEKKGFAGALVKELAEKFVRLGYKRSTMVSDIGEFSIRGDIIDVYSLDKKPVRIELWGDEVVV